MIKKNLPILLLTSLIIILPILAGLLLWNRLPDQIPIHWNMEGVVDRHSSKAFAVFTMPGIILVIHWICTLLTSADPKVKNLESKSLILVFWICPFVSLLVGTLVYASALGFGISTETVVPLIMGGLFIVLGNYMPKFRQNYTIGFKLPWTLSDEENWRKTHRLAGIVMVCGGVLMMITALIGSVWLMLGLLIVMILIPVVYSFADYRKNHP